MDVVGIDNDMRKSFFGKAASTAWNRDLLLSTVPRYRHEDIDIRDKDRIDSLFADFGAEIVVVIHTAAQPSHDWAANNPFTDFTINANGTLILLEAFRAHCPDAVFLNMSTNKVYGDAPNELPLIEKDTRWSLDPSHPFAENGIDETMSIDTSVHSLFGVSKAAGDLLVQEYGRNFGFKTACLGRLFDRARSFWRATARVSRLPRPLRCHRNSYTIFGYKGKQVRDNLHSDDLAEAFWAVYENPRAGEIYNMGGGAYANCSVFRGHHALRRDHRPADGMDPRRRKSDRRSYLVRQRSWPIPRSLSSLGTKIYDGVDDREIIEELQNRLG